MGSLFLLNYPQALHDPGRTADLPRDTTHSSERRPAGSSRRRRSMRGSNAMRTVRWCSSRWGRFSRPETTCSPPSPRACDSSTFAWRWPPAPPTRAAWARCVGVARQFLFAPGEHPPAGQPPGHARGNNSVTEALAHRVPMLALPFSTDQFDGAAAIEAAGLGFAADPNRVTPLEVAEAVRCMIGSPTRRWIGLRSSLHYAPVRASRGSLDEWLGPQVRRGQGLNGHDDQWSSGSAETCVCTTTPPAWTAAQADGDRIAPLFVIDERHQADASVRPIACGSCAGSVSALATALEVRGAPRPSCAAIRRGSCRRSRQRSARRASWPAATTRRTAASATIGSRWPSLGAASRGARSRVCSSTSRRTLPPRTAGRSACSGRSSEPGSSDRTRHPGGARCDRGRRHSPRS